MQAKAAKQQVRVHSKILPAQIGRVDGLKTQHKSAKDTE